MYKNMDAPLGRYVSSSSSSFIIIINIVIFCYEENILLLPWWIFWQFVHGGRGLWTRFHRHNLRSTREVIGRSTGETNNYLVNKLSIGQENNQLGNKTINGAKKQSIMQTINWLGNKTIDRKKSSSWLKKKSQSLLPAVIEQTNTTSNITKTWKIEIIILVETNITIHVISGNRTNKHYQQYYKNMKEKNNHLG